jgi:peptidoglycan/xylan/chitin deacetylase (PgdA/CDA1 family)
VVDRPEDPRSHRACRADREGGELTPAQAIAAEPLGYGRSTDGFDATYYLEERFARRARTARSLTLYYRLKPLIPRRAQIALRRSLARCLRRRHEVEGRFPRWPVEPLLVERREAHLRERLRRSGAARVPFVGLWPGGHRFAYVLTHDVEGPRGLAEAKRLLEVEARHGMVSAWFLVAEDYPVEPAVLDAIRAAGGEVGLHGLHHDGRLFESRDRFERQLPRIHRYLSEWDAEGFRSPATHRHAGWMPELGSCYDSSFHDTDPFDAQPGGCCSILPYFLGDLVELPITLPHDFTLFEILRERDIGLWREKASWIAEHGGLVNVLVHPDYALTEERRRHYDELLGFLASLDGGWHALPRDVARWWRRRAALEARLAEDGALTAEALAAAGASLSWAQEHKGSIAITTSEEGHASS